MPPSWPWVGEHAWFLRCLRAWWTYLDGGSRQLLGQGRRRMTSLMSELTVVTDRRFPHGSGQKYNQRG